MYYFEATINPSNTKKSLLYCFDADFIIIDADWQNVKKSFLNFV